MQTNPMALSEAFSIGSAAGLRSFVSRPKWSSSVEVAVESLLFLACPR